MYDLIPVGRHVGWKCFTSPVQHANQSSSYVWPALRLAAAENLQEALGYMKVVSWDVALFCMILSLQRKIHLWILRYLSLLLRELLLSYRQLAACIAEHKNLIVTYLELIPFSSSLHILQSQQVFGLILLNVENTWVLNLLCSVLATLNSTYNSVSM